MWSPRQQLSCGITQVRSGTVTGSFYVFQFKHGLQQQKVDKEPLLPPHLESPDVDPSDKWPGTCNKCWTNVNYAKAIQHRDKNKKTKADKGSLDSLRVLIYTFVKPWRIFWMVTMSPRSVCEMHTCSVEAVASTGVFGCTYCHPTLINKSESILFCVQEEAGRPRALETGG